MAISGVGQSYYQNNVATTKSTKSVNSTGETGNTKELSEAEEMAIFKKEFYAEIDKIPRNRTITNVAINISEEAFKNMKDDPEYREKILSALKRDLTSSFAPLEASMVLTVGANSSYTSYYASNYKNTVKKTDSEKDSTNTKDGNVTTSTVELKTSRPGVTKTEQIKTGYSNVNDYSKYLQGKYHYMNIGLTSMQGIPTTVSVSSAFLQKCMNDPEKAKYLEENLAAIPDCTKDTINGCLGTVTNQSYMIDANGNIIETASGTNDPDGKIAKENAERKAKENREKEEKVKEKRAAKKAEEEKAAKKRAEKSAERKETGDYTLSVTGTDVKSMTQSLVAGSVSISVPDRSSFDIKA